MNRKNFTLIELLVVISIIGVLVSALAFSLGGAVDDAKVLQAKTSLTGLETAAKSYRTTYGKPPKRLEDLLEDNNPRKIEFLDIIPVDIFSLSKKAQVKVIYGVSNVTKDIEGNISDIELDGNGMVVYSIGPNQEDNGGFNDGKVSQEQEDTAKDDIATYIDF